MKDENIVKLYFDREERAIDETRKKYGKLLHHIAFNILNSAPDSEECVDDTYIKAWKSIPPTSPVRLGAFLSKITRNLSINRYLKNKSEREMLNTDTVFEEISECIPSGDGSISEDLALREAINGFIGTLDATKRKLFVKRYFFMRPIKQVASEMKLTVSNVKITLMRIREDFKAYLEKEGIII